MYLQEIKQLEMDMLDMQSEVNRLCAYNASFTKEEKMIKQMLKANEVRIRSIEKENQQLKAKLSRTQLVNRELKTCVARLAADIESRGGQSADVMRAIGNVGELVCLDEILGNAESLNTEEELQASIAESAEDAHAQGPNGDDKASESQDSLSSQHLQVTSPRRNVMSSSQKEKEKSQYKLKLEEEIEKNIQSRSRVKEIKDQRRSLKSRRLVGIQPREADLSAERTRAEGVSEEEDDPEKEKLFLKCRITDARIFDEQEKEEIRLMIRNMKSVENFCLWLWGCFEQKCLKQAAEYQQLETEKSRANRRVEGAAAADQAGRGRDPLAQVPLDEQGAPAALERKCDHQPACTSQQKEPDQADPEARAVSLQKQDAGEGEETARGPDRRVPADPPARRRRRRRPLRVELFGLGCALAAAVALVELEALIPAREGPGEPAPQERRQFDFGGRAQ